MSNQQWWYEQGGQPKGPLGSDEIRSMVESGALARSNRIIVVGGSEWGTVDEHATELGLGSTASAGIGTAAPPGPVSMSSQASAPATMGYAQPAYSPGGAGGAPIVSNGRRIGAYLLEGLLVVVTLFIGYLIWMLVILGKGQTPGKQLLGLRVVDTESRKVPSYGKMAVRVLVYQGLLGSVSGGITTIVGGVMILMDKELRQGLWDKLANTVVVQDPEGTCL